MVNNHYETYENVLLKSYEAELMVSGKSFL